MTFLLHVEASGQTYEITERDIGSTLHRYVDGATYDLAEQYDNVGDMGAYVTKNDKMLTSEQLDEIRNTEIREGR